MFAEQKYGYFNSDGSEFIITDPQTPRAFDNFLWNDVLFSNVQQTGTGYCDYQIGEKEAVQLLTGVGRICDFDVFGRDHLMSRLIYIRDNDTGEFWNVNWEPVQMTYEVYECRHGLGYTTISTRVKGIESVFRIFVPMGKDPVELWSIIIKNTSKKKRSLSVFLYNQFQFKFKWGFDSYGDMIYRKSYLSVENNAAIAVKRPYIKPHDYLMGFMAADEKITAFDGNRESFVGIYNTLKEPKAVVKGRCSNTPGSADSTICATQFDFELGLNEEKNISVILGATDDEKNIGRLKDKYLGNFETYFRELVRQKNEMQARNKVNTPDVHFNRMLNSWTKQAASFGAAWCRWGWNGFRDIVQHGLGVAALQPERTRAILLEAFRYQYRNGLAVRGWNPVDEKPYSDSALWLVFTLIAYIRETGDTCILQEQVPFYDDKVTASVWEHIVCALDFLERNKGNHGLLLIKFGDWNDSLTSVGKLGKGESVWLSEAYAEALDQMAGLTEFMGDKEKNREYKKRRAEILNAINSEAWDGNWYARCFDDFGKPVGSKGCKEGKIFMEPQSWALISGAADDERMEALVKSCDDMLLTSAGYLLLSPSFTEIDPGIGRISSMQPGIAENGTVYSHLNIWMIEGLLRKRKASKAYDILKRVTPGYINGEADPKRECPPYMYANCYFGPDHINNRFQMEFTWVTGSVAWFSHVLLNEMLGAKACFDGLLVDPCIPPEWEFAEICRNFRGDVYEITIHNPMHLTHGIQEIEIDGRVVAGNLIPVIGDGKVHKVKAVINGHGQQ